MGDDVQRLVDAEVIHSLPPSMRHVIGTLDEASREAFVREYTVRTKKNVATTLLPSLTRVANERTARHILETLHLCATSAAPSVAGAKVVGADLELVTQERLEAFMKSRDYTYQVDGDGDLTGVFNERQFWFIRVGTKREVVIVRGTNPLENRPVSPELHALLNDLNSRFTIPKTFIQFSDQLPSPLMVCDITVDFEKGATDDQLTFMLESAISTIAKFYEKFNEEVAKIGLGAESLSDVVKTGLYL